MEELHVSIVAGQHPTAERIAPGLPRPLPSLQDDAAAAILDDARARAGHAGLAFAGEIAPESAWELFAAGVAQIVDVRSAEEWKFVGHIPNTLHVPWATGLSLNRNPRFVRELEAKTGKDAIVLLLCRSGKRSALAAEAATKAGFTHVFNIQQGFEGDIDERQQRGGSGGWRHTGLPWIQD